MAAGQRTLAPAAGGKEAEAGGLGGRARALEPPTLADTRVSRLYPLATTVHVNKNVSLVLWPAISDTGSEQARAPWRPCCTRGDDS